MPLQYQIDCSRGLVICRGTGELTDDQWFEFFNLLHSDPDFDPTFDELVSTQEVTDNRVTPNGIRRAVELNKFTAPSKRAFVVATKYAYGMSRMYQTMLEPSMSIVQVYENMSDAVAWLELDSDFDFAAVFADSEILIADQHDDGFRRNPG